MPTLAMIPMQRGASDDPVKEMAERARSPLADGVRSLRTALHLAAEPNGGSGRAVLITSSVPKEGKSFVSLYLSLLFSKSHDRVLLIDGDVHRPRLHKALGVEGGVGLAQVLKDEAAFDDVVRRGIGGSLDFLPAGHCEDLAEVVQPERAAALLEMLKSRYALIVIDSPPALAVADTRILARLADHVVYLVRWNATPRDAVRNGVKLLRGAGVRLSGIVLSQVNQRKHSKYGYGDYGQYYGRYRQYYGG